MKNSVKLFENRKIRAKWDEGKEKCFFSIIDVVGILTEKDFQTARNY